MTNAEQKQLDKEMERHEQRLTALADKRLARLAKWFKSKFLGHTLKITFGMGSEFIEVDGVDVDWYNVASDLRPIVEALEDVGEITDQYRQACPNNIDI